MDIVLIIRVKKHTGYGLIGSMYSWRAFELAKLKIDKLKITK